MTAKITLPDCGMFLGVPVYLDRGDYIFQTTGPFYTSWVSEDHDPEWYLQKVVDDNQGNLVVLWDGGASDKQLKSMAWMEDLEGIGISVPAPDWENNRNLIPEDFPPCAEYKSTRFGAGFFKFVEKAAELGLYSYSIYTDATPEWTAKIVANPKFIGYNAGEAFCFNSGFCTRHVKSGGDPNDFTLETVAEKFGETINNYFAVRKANGWNRFFVTSGSFHLDFEIAAGGREIIPHMEGIAFPHLNFGMSQCRGIYKQCDLPLWGCYLAHEHYAFLPLASKYRSMVLNASYYLSYLNGSKIAIQECGSWWQQSDHIPDTPMHNVPKFTSPSNTIGDNNAHDYAHLVKEARRHYPNLNYDSEVCREYRKSVSDFYDYLKVNGTPEGQPEVNFAVLKGRWDFCSSEYLPQCPVGGAGAVAERNAFWYQGIPEYTWEIFRKAVLPLNNSFGEYKNTFFSGTPYGLCDIVGLTPGITADFLLENYKTLMMTGWNSAREEDYRILLDYVRGGGILFLAVPHLSKNIRRNYVSYGADELIHGGDFTELAGVKVKGRGKQFYWSLCIDKSGEIYPYYQRYGVCYTHMADLEITGDIEPILVDDEQFEPFLFRHKCGKGEVYFMNSWEYPGCYGGDLDGAPGSRRESCGATGEIFRYLAKRARGTAYITEDGADSIGENCKCISFSYFASTNKVYMLNCDFSESRTFHLHTPGNVRKFTLKPAEFMAVDA